MSQQHDPVEELLGAYALDAVDPDERRLVEALLAEDPQARAEVQAHREVAALLSFSGDAAPDGLWDRIADSLEDRAPEPGPELARVLPIGRRRRRRGLLVSAGAAALAAAAAVAATLVIVDDDGIPGGPGTEDVVEWAYGEAWADPDARRAQLTSEDDALTAEAVIDEAGYGFLSAKALPTLPSSETYQLWGVYGDGDVISLGVIGNRPGIEPFRADGDINAVVITLEQAGGVVSSTSGALLVGELS
jgi:anti-sigma-K factor RskA